MKRGTYGLGLLLVLLLGLSLWQVWRTTRPPESDPRQEQVFTLAAPVTSVAISPDNQWVAAGGKDGTVTLWNHATGEQVWQQTRHRRMIGALAFVANGTGLLSGGTDAHLWYWSIPSGTARQLHPDIRTDRYPDDFASIFVIQQLDNQTALLGGRKGQLQWLDSQQERVLATYNDDSPYRLMVAGATSDAWFFARQYDSTLHLVDLTSLRVTRTLPMPEIIGVDHVELTADGTTLVTIGGGAVATWQYPDLTPRQPFQPFRPIRDVIPAYALTRDGRWFARSGGTTMIKGYWFHPFLPETDTTIYVHATANPQEPILKLYGHTGLARGLAFSNDGQYLVSGSDDKTVRVWRVGE